MSARVYIGCGASYGAALDLARSLAGKARDLGLEVLGRGETNLAFVTDQAIDSIRKAHVVIVLMDEPLAFLEVGAAGALGIPPLLNDLRSGGPVRLADIESVLDGLRDGAATST